MPHYKLSQLWDVWCDQNWNPKGALHKNSDYGINVHANACCHKAWHRVSKWQLFVTLNYFPAWGCRQLWRVRQIQAHLFLYLFWKNKVDLWSVTFLKLNGGFYSFDRRWCICHGRNHNCVACLLAHCLVLITTNQGVYLMAFTDYTHRLDTGLQFMH